uniref:Antimicrobial peptide 3 n=1 Tax=Cocos nucifera TaxID=13894 RepID=AMP3_COCNU|nr:RecName: Full=Antimicrobial peptide 3; Short=Cn-AMP3 [Cocos nucifera]
YCSYTMEA